MTPPHWRVTIPTEDCPYKVFLLGPEEKISISCLRADHGAGNPSLCIMETCPCKEA